MKSLFLLIGMGWALSFGSWTWAEPEVPKPEVKKPQITAEEEVALGKFKVAMSEMKEGLQDELEKLEHEDPKHWMALTLTERLEKIPTEGLPKDLAEAFATYWNAYRNQAKYLKNVPKDEGKAKQRYMEKFQDKNCKMEDTQYKSTQALIHVALAYGLEKEVDLFDVRPGEVWVLMPDRWVVVLGAAKEFPEAKKLAEALSTKVQIPFTMRGMVFDSEGLHYPERVEDEGDEEVEERMAGCYDPRRDNTVEIEGKEVKRYLSIEISDEYEGFPKGRYIVVAKICETKKDADKEAEAFKTLVPEAYAKRTKIFMGCTD